MTDPTSLGYPLGYHLGISSILWGIFIVFTVVLGLGLFANARKSDLINVKEVLRAKSSFYIGTSTGFLLIQAGVLFPDNFLQFYYLGLFSTMLPATFYFYYWEKYLTVIKRIPTISMGSSCILTSFAIILSLLIPELPLVIWDLMTLAIFSLLSLSFVLYLYLVYLFSKNTKGGHFTTVGAIWLTGITIGLIANFVEHPPGVIIVPKFILLYINPIMYMCSFLLAFLGITKLLSQISSYYAQTQKCAVHRGKIEKGNPIHYCSSCGIVYCEKCFSNVIAKDGCWNCRKGVEFEKETDKIEIKGIDLKKKQQ